MLTAAQLFESSLPVTEMFPSCIWFCTLTDKQTPNTVQQSLLFAD